MNSLTFNKVHVLWNSWLTFIFVKFIKLIKIIKRPGTSPSKFYWPDFGFKCMERTQIYLGCVCVYVGHLTTQWSTLSVANLHGFVWVLPEYLCQKLMLVFESQPYNLRQNNLIRLPNYWTAIAQNSLMNKGIGMHRDLLRKCNVENRTSLRSFKKMALLLVKQDYNSHKVLRDWGNQLNISTKDGVLLLCVTLISSSFCTAIVLQKKKNF